MVNCDCERARRENEINHIIITCVVIHIYVYTYYGILLYYNINEKEGWIIGILREE